MMPNRIHRLVRVQRAEGVRPALLHKAAEAGARVGLDQRSPTTVVFAGGRRNAVFVGLTRSLPGTHRDDLARRRRRKRFPAGDRPDMGPRHRVIGYTRKQATQFDRRGEFAVLREDDADRVSNSLGDQEHGPHDDAVRRALQATLS